MAFYRSRSPVCGGSAMALILQGLRAAQVRLRPAEGAAKELEELLGPR